MKNHNFCDTKRILIVYIWKYSGKSSREISKIFNISESAISRITQNSLIKRDRNINFDLYFPKYSTEEKTEDELLLGNNYKLKDVLKEL